MNKQLCKSELKAYINRNKVYSCYAPLFAFVVYLFVFILVLLTSHITKLCESIGMLNYEYIATGHEQWLENSFYKFDNLSTMSSSVKKVNVNTYIQLENCQYSDDMPMKVAKLKKNEIAVSRKIADRQEINIGDKVLIEDGLTESGMEYTVAAIFEYIDDYYDYSKNTDFSVVLLGYDNDLIERKRGSFVTFLTENQRDSFLNSEVMYTGIHSTYDEKTEVKVKSIMHGVLFGIFYLLVFAVFMVWERKQEKDELRRYYRDGYNVKTIKWLHDSYRRYIILPELVAISLFLIFSIDYWYVWIVLNMALYLIVWGRETSYEKAH